MVSVPDFDHSACGGTHPRSTGGVGQIVVQRWAKQKNGVRVEFACGGRALRAHQRLNHIGQCSAALLSVGIDELEAAVERLRTSNDVLRNEIAALQDTNLSYFARDLAHRALQHRGRLRVVAQTLSGQPEYLRSVAQRLIDHGIDIALIGAGGERMQLVVASAAASGLDARSILAVGLAPIGGRGGGSAILAQGGGPAQEDPEAVLAAMLEALPRP
ncbi:hypothetical protein HC891_12845 [Candidatus Gracilibacteria bacterium]|nr:hypothetical protein [Candidatus Gracilibacteria bacterium]